MVATMPVHNGRGRPSCAGPASGRWVPQPPAVV